MLHFDLIVMGLTFCTKFVLFKTAPTVVIQLPYYHLHSGLTVRL